MKKNVLNNTDGISICDSIVMSVQKKQPNLRKAEAIFIAVLGFVSIIFSFLGMFSFSFNEAAVGFAAVGFSLFYILIAVIGGRCVWLISASLIVLAVTAFKMIDKIVMGYKFIYNIIYRTAYRSEINYYKFLDPELEAEAVTTLFIFYVWLLAAVIYFFTISRPNPVLPLIVSFPIIEIGLYNGIEIPVFWGITTVAYWFSLLAMSNIDIGEYSGGNGAFVRKDNLFFPKRQMKLKVTEKCGIFVIAVVLLITSVTVAFMRVSGYERSDEINRKRKEISSALQSFKTENLTESLSRLSQAFGFKFKDKSQKLGNNDHIEHKNITELIVNLNKKSEYSIYLKEYTASIYDDNEWFELDDEAYNDKIFADFEKYGIFPQDFPYLFSPLVSQHNDSDYKIIIESRLKKDRRFSPYGVNNYAGLVYNKDISVSNGDENSKSDTFRYVPIDQELLSENISGISTGIYSLDSLNSEKWIENIRSYSEENDLLYGDSSFELKTPLNDDFSYLNNNPHAIMAMLLQNDYSKFVFKNYLQLPDNNNMQEIREEYSDILNESKNALSIEKKFEILGMIRDKIGNDVKYSLSPGKTPSNRDFTNYFLLENRKGYCVHYATAGVLLARMAGIPARYVTGYVIVSDDFNTATVNHDGSYVINVKDSRSHAWAEVYIDGFGWVPYEFTAGYSNSSVNSAVQPSTSAPQTSSPITTTMPQNTTSANASATSQQTSIATQTSIVTTIFIPETGTYIVSGSTTASEKELPLFIKIILIIIFVLAVFIGAILLRRQIILNIRRKNFSTGSYSRRIGFMYSYSEKLFALLNLENDDKQYVRFTEKIEETLGDSYFDKGSFNNFMNIALKSGFGNTQPTKTELQNCEKFVNDFAGSIYAESTFFNKLILKFFRVLI